MGLALFVRIDMELKLFVRIGSASRVRRFGFDAI